MHFCSSRRQHAAVALHSIISIISIWLLARGQLDDSFVTARHLRPLRHQRSSQAACTGQGEGTPWRPGPAKVRSLAGQKARQLLVENPVLFEVNLEEELSSLSSSPALPMQDGANRSTKDAALASLRARIQEVQESDRGRSASELIYLAVCAGFQRAGYSPVQSLQAGGRVDLGSKLLNEDLLTSRIHSEEVLGAVEDHLTQSMPGGMAAKNSAALQQTVLLPQFNLGQAYAMTIQYGYVLRRAQSRLQLERSLHPSAEGLDSLRSYLKRIGPGMFQDAMVSVEAHVAAKLQVEGVFGDLQMLKGQLMKSIESRRSSGRDTGAMLQEAVSAGEVASLLLGASDVRRLLLEAAAFGALLWEAESKASELASLVPSKQPRLSDFGVQADGDGNPVIPESD